MPRTPDSRLQTLDFGLPTTVLPTSIFHLPSPIGNHPLVFTFNEAPNIGRTLSRLTWAKRIVVVDSFSMDETETICRKIPQVEFVQRKFDTFADQCNFGLEQIRTPWVLSMDADYVLDDGFADEVAALLPEADVAGYRAGFVYCIHGRRLRATLYPPRVVLYRRDRAKYRNEGHGHRVQIEGRVLPLRSRILHDDRKPLERWFGEQLKYSAQEAAFLLGDNGNRRTENGRRRAEVSGQLPAPRAYGPEGWSVIRHPSSVVRGLSFPDRIRKLIVVAPVAVFFYTLLGKGLILDGWPGWYYVFQRTLAEVLLSLRLIEQKLTR